MTKQFRVCMDGEMLVWATDVDDARDRARAEFNLWHYAEETGLQKDDEEDVDGDA